jgi:general secretion pathway protein J
MKRSAGFTLLEILVALVVFGLLLAGLTQGIQYGLQAWQSQVRMTGSRDDLDAVDRALRHMIEVIDPGDGMGPAPFAASRDELEFISVLPDEAGAQPVRPVSAELLVDSAHRLVLRWRPYINARLLKPSPASTATELLQGVSRLELSYWRPDGGWVSAWAGPDLPALIRIHIVFPQGDPRYWPDIIAAPLIDRP